MCLEKWPAESLDCEGTHNITMQVHSRELIPSVTLQWRCVQRQSLCYKQFCLCVCVCARAGVCVCMSSLRLKVPGKPNYMKSNSVEKGRERIVKAGRKRWQEMEVGKEWASLKAMRTAGSWQAIPMNQGARNSPESRVHWGWTVRTVRLFVTSHVS